LKIQPVDSTKISAHMIKTYFSLSAALPAHIREFDDYIEATRHMSV